MGHRPPDTRLILYLKLKKKPAYRSMTEVKEVVKAIAGLDVGNDEVTETKRRKIYDLSVKRYSCDVRIECNDGKYLYVARRDLRNIGVVHQLASLDLEVTSIKVKCDSDTVNTALNILIDYVNPFYIGCDRLIRVLGFFHRYHASTGIVNRLRNFQRVVKFKVISEMIRLRYSVISIISDWLTDRIQLESEIPDWWLERANRCRFDEKHAAGLIRHVYPRVKPQFRIVDGEEKIVIQQCDKVLIRVAEGPEYQRVAKAIMSAPVTGLIPYMLSLFIAGAKIQTDDGLGEFDEIGGFLPQTEIKQESKALNDVFEDLREAYLSIEDVNEFGTYVVDKLRGVKNATESTMLDVARRHSSLMMVLPLDIFDNAGDGDTVIRTFLKALTVIYLDKLYIRHKRREWHATKVCSIDD